MSRTDLELAMEVFGAWLEAECARLKNDTGHCERWFQVVEIHHAFEVIFSGNMPEGAKPMSVNKIILVGRLGKNPELRETNNGNKVGNFSVATSSKRKDKNDQWVEDTTWHSVVVWGKLAEICAQHLSKGSQVFVEGEVRTREYQKKDGTQGKAFEVHANSVQFLGKKDGPSQAQDEGSAPDDDLPF